MIQSDKNCSYCSLISGKISPNVSIIHNDEIAFAFLSHVPVTLGHIIIASKKHYPNLSALPNPLAGQMLYIASRIGIACKRALESDGYNIIASDGSSAGQDIPHAYLHMIPRYINDGFHLNWRILKDPPSSEIAKKIKSKLKL